FYFLRKCSPIEFMNFDIEELNRRPYQVLATLYHLNRFFVQNAEYDNFNPKKHALEWVKQKNLLKKPDLWLLSRLQKTIEEFTNRLERCEFNIALAELENFVVEVISRLYVPMIRKELWSDDPETLNRRLAIYATLWHVLKTTTLLFNPISPYLCEALYQKIYRRLDPALPESVNFESWPKPDEKMRNQALEEDFELLFQCVSLVYSARQSAKLKRRWPLRRVAILAPEKVWLALKNVEEVFLELANIKVMEQIKTEAAAEKWVSASEGDITIFLDAHRDEKLLGEGLMRDLARRVQSLRKELGYMPTDILDSVHIAGLEDESIKLVKPYLKEMEELVRARKIYLHSTREEVEAKWHEYQLDDKKIYVAILNNN
ncbi:MAG: class I tRNA ligase family protein, partial [Candidatus Bathyarchaeia archaeon]